MGYRAFKPQKELEFKVGPLAGRSPGPSIPIGFVFSDEEIEAWGQRMSRVSQGESGWLQYTDAEPTDPNTLVAAGSSTGVERDGGTTGAAVPTAVIEVPEDDPDGADPEDLSEPDAVKYPSHLGGGLYRLSDGNTVRGRRAAMDAQSSLLAESAA